MTREIDDGGIRRQQILVDGPDMSLRNVDRLSTILLGASLLSLIYGIGRLYNELT